MNHKINKNSISLSGEFAVLSQLALRGYDANMALGHTKGVDILISDPQTRKMYRLEVKTNYKNSRNQPHKSKLFGKVVSGWIMNKKHETIKDNSLFYCFVNIGKSDCKYRFFIAPSKVVADYVKQQHKYWMSAKKSHKDSKMRVFRIGLADENYNIATPTAEKYEDNWGFKK